MAVTLGIEIVQVPDGYDEESNTSIVNVSVRAYYTGGSWNATGNASGTLYINGVSYPFKTTFNSMQQDYGNEVIYAETVVIDRSVTDVVDCSATFNTGTASGTISASNSLTLSGESSGDDSGDDDEDVVYRYYNLECTIGNHTRIVIKSTKKIYHIITESKTLSFLVPESEPVPYVYAEATEGYEIASFTKKGVEVSDKGYFVMNFATDGPTYGYNIFATTARPKTIVNIDNGEELIPYLVCIDDGETWYKYAPYIDNGETWELHC